ncbi:6152_t:CDS:1 [Cetraspora pellucida]|uniref:6152_t:CDS:1 n=1 Tax=Cetraspora pellucida TaxID=1433469 RepID=A0A9N9J3X7_9GLOM|nr:6152_t:CDS:1 [Cetraspora pellucida]
MQKPFREHEGELFQEETATEPININNGISDSVTNNNHEQMDDIEPNDEKYLCRFFQRGICRYSEGCRYSHETSAPVSTPKFGVLTHPRSTTPCRFFVKGYCRYGEDCKFAH